MGATFLLRLVVYLNSLFPITPLVWINNLFPSAAKGIVDGQLGECPSNNFGSNCVVSEDDYGNIDPLEYIDRNNDTDAVWDSLLDFLRDDELVIDIKNPDHIQYYVHSIFETPALKFRDDVEFRLDLVDRVIHVRSASRVGQDDTGTNRERVEDIREEWDPSSSSRRRMMMIDSLNK